MGTQEKGGITEGNVGEGGWVDWTEDEEEADREEDGAKGNQAVVVIAHKLLVQMERSSDVPEVVCSGCGASSWMT